MTKAELANSGDFAAAMAAAGATIRRVEPTNFLPNLFGFPSVQMSGSRPMARARVIPVLPAPQKIIRRSQSSCCRRSLRLINAACRLVRDGAGMRAGDSPLAKAAIKLALGVTA